MQLAQAQQVADDLVRTLEPTCEQIEVAGSIRRQKADPKDVEIVYIPRMIPIRTDMFSDGPGSAAAFLIACLVTEGGLAWDLLTKRNGPKYKRLIHVESGIVVEFFRAQRENWGLVLALRTGPGDFNRIWAAKPWHRGLMPIDMAMRDAFLWRLGERIETPTEEVFFAELGIPCWPPEERSAPRLGRWLVEQKVQS